MEDVEIVDLTVSSEAWPLLGYFNSVRGISARCGMVSFDAAAVAEFNVVWRMWKLLI